MGHEAVCLEGVNFAYASWPVLEEVSLLVARGEYVCILGPNGGGKTTLLKIILGLTMPQSGRVSLLGQRPEQARMRAGYMPQAIQSDLQVPVTVKEVVLMGRLGGGGGWRYSRSDLKKAEEVLAFLGLEPMKDRFFGELSGGQRQRTLLARALACDPEVLLLDEPTANVDPEGGKLLAELLAELKGKIALLLVTHDLSFVSKHVDRVFCVNRRVVEHPTSELDSSSMHELYNEPMRLVRHDLVLGNEER